MNPQENAMLNTFLEYYTQHPWLVVPLAILSAVGVGLLWMGWLTLMITAFGQKLWLWGFAILLLPVPASQGFALRYRTLNPWANRLVWWGLVLSLPILALTAWWAVLALTAQG
ncbi:MULTISPECIES: hypothetical protein [Alcanivorax]|jgi:hypothetical protein|nr:MULTISPECIES: hypothetical protein [Alcanivorax]MED5432558.1 hypothetical protein [Pseudomonadota bacterium]|tara:strand:- start:171 stop:509 length:339 start_codon:yes stop_codon:yes gene_type:complete